MGYRYCSLRFMNFPKLSKSTFPAHMPDSFSAAGFWQVLRKIGNLSGRKLLISALTLYHCMRDSETPAWAKSVILGALGYLIFPTDFIPDIILGAGFTDDMGVILGALTTVFAHIKDVHKEKAKAMADRFFEKPSSNEAIEIPTVRD